MDAAAGEFDPHGVGQPFKGMLGRIVGTPHRQGDETEDPRGAIDYTPTPLGSHDANDPGGQVVIAKEIALEDLPQRLPG